MALVVGRACRQRIPGRAAALVVGALPALALPAPSWWWLAWFGVVPLLLVVRAAPTPREAAVRAACGISGFVLTNQYWLNELSNAQIDPRKLLNEAVHVKHRCIRQKDIVLANFQLGAGLAGPKETVWRR